MKNKKCTKCGDIKDVKMFSVKGKAVDGLRCQCKTCDADYRIKTKIHIKDWAKQFRKARLDYSIFSSAKARALKKGLEFSLVLKDIVIPDVCPIFGIKLIKGDNKREDGSPSIDRIDNSKGYSKDNIIIISWRANKLKGESSHEERVKILEFYRKYEK